MRRPVVVLVSLAALATAAAAPRTPPPEPEASHREVTATTLACPEHERADGSWQVVTFAADAGAVAGRTGRIWAEDLTGGPVLAATEEADRPVSVSSVGQSPATTVVGAEGAFAPGAVAGTAAEVEGGAGRGSLSSQCLVARGDWWFLGSGSDQGRDSVLLVSNPTSQLARYDIEVYGATGAIQSVGTRDLELAPHSQARIRLAALTQAEPALAIHLRATIGGVAAWLRDVAPDYLDRPQGTDLLPGTMPPATRLTITGLPTGAGPRDLVLFNPNSTLATARVRLMEQGGPRELPGLPNVAVPAGRVVTVPLERVLAGSGGALDLTSDGSISAAVRVSTAGTSRDLMWLTATKPTLPENPLAAAGAVQVGPGLVTVVSVAAPDAEARGLLTILPAGTAPTVIDVSVPRGASREFVLPSSAAGVVSITWRCAPGAGPALVSHRTGTDESLTGYQWWPTVSTLDLDPVREDVGALLANAADTHALMGDVGGAE